MTKLSLILAFLLLCNIAHAQPAPCVYEWCDTVLPKAVGEKVVGKDNCGNVCSKHGIAVAAPTASPVAAKPETAIVPKEEAIVQPAKDLLRSQGNVEGITVTLFTNSKGEPVMSAFCEKGGLTEWDYRMYQDGYKQKVKKVGNQMHVYYEK